MSIFDIELNDTWALQRMWFSSALKDHLWLAAGLIWQSRKIPPYRMRHRQIRNDDLLVKWKSLRAEIALMGIHSIFICFVNIDTSVWTAHRFGSCPLYVWIHWWMKLTYRFSFIVVFKPAKYAWFNDILKVVLCFNPHIFAVKNGRDRQSLYYMRWSPCSWKQWSQVAETIKTVIGSMCYPFRPSTEFSDHRCCKGLLQRQ